MPLSNLRSPLSPVLTVPLDNLLQLRAVLPGVQRALGIAPGQPPWHRYR